MVLLPGAAYTFAYEREAGAYGIQLSDRLIRFVVGHGSNKGWRWTRTLVGASRHPRAWDYLWSEDRRLIVRLRLKSGEYVAGLYARDKSGSSGYAAGYGEQPDLYLHEQLRVDAQTGAFQRGSDGGPIRIEPATGLLVRWDEVEVAHIQEITHG